MNIAQRLSEHIARLADGEAVFDRSKYRQSVVDELRILGTDQIVPHLVAAFLDPDPECRCVAADLLLRLDTQQGPTLVLPLFHDGDSVVRWSVIGSVRQKGNEALLDPITERLKNDPDPCVRTVAAHALGMIASPKAIPALLRAMETDHELDLHGHSASSCAASALDDIIGTNITRIAVTATLRKMAP